MISIATGGTLEFNADSKGGDDTRGIARLKLIKTRKEGS